jgi:polysaccharide biosynthesis transport protein
MTESGLRREVERAEALYQDVSTRFENARLASLSETPDVRVVDWADPPTQPDADRRTLLAGMAFFGLPRSRAPRSAPSRSARSPRAFSGRRGVPVGDPGPRGTPAPAEEATCIRPEDHEQAVEAFRSVRTGLLYAHGTAGPIVMTISSPGAGDGKSFTASNLALSFAELGRRTILVDGDVRRGVQHELFDVERKPGLSDFLADGLSAEAVTRQCKHPNLSVIPLGSRMSNAPELLSTGRMQELLADLRAEYDVIIVDSSPLGAAADPVILGIHTGSLSLVVRSGTTNVEHAEAMLQNLRHYPVRVLGAVVNDVQARDDYSYYGYISGYSVVPSEEEKGRRADLQLTGAK